MGIFARERLLLLLFQLFFTYFSEEVPDLGRTVETCIFVILLQVLKVNIAASVV
jgi:hypothetical protein